MHVCYGFCVTFKVHSHSPQRSADSAVDCVNAEIGIFYLCGATQPSAADARGKRSNVNEPLWM